jgi:hypothetical protein
VSAFYPPIVEVLGLRIMAKIITTRDFADPCRFLTRTRSLVCLACHCCDPHFHGAAVTYLLPMRKMKATLIDLWLWGSLVLLLDSQAPVSRRSPSYLLHINLLS